MKITPIATNANAAFGKISDDDITRDCISVLSTSKENSDKDEFEKFQHDLNSIERDPDVTLLMSCTQREFAGKQEMRLQASLRSYKKDRQFSVSVPVQKDDAEKSLNKIFQHIVNFNSAAKEKTETER